MMTRIRRFLTRNPNSYLKDNKGAAAIEWGLTISLFLLLFMNILEFGIIMFGNAVIANMVSQTARASMIGCPNGEVKFNPDGRTAFCVGGQAFNEGKLKQDIQKKSLGFVQASNQQKFKFGVSRLQDIPADQNFPKGGDVDLADGRDVVVFYASYDWPTMNPASFVRKFFAKKVKFEMATMVRNEPFGDLKR